uniref:Uncharacterized protein n=1 Tax=Oryza glumipatula TaxID=40148 RepID=A0A0E0B2L2_9ORYZ
MASSSSSSLLRSVARELRRSIPPPRPRPAMSVMDRLAPRLLSTESSNHKMNPSSSSSPLLDNFFRSDRAKRMDTSKVQFSKDDLKEFDRYLDERTKRAERNLLLSLDKFCDACERRASLLRDIKAMLEARNKRSAQKFLLVKQWAVLISYSSVLGFALYNLHLFS